MYVSMDGWMDRWCAQMDGEMDEYYRKMDVQTMKEMERKRKQFALVLFIYSAGSQIELVNSEI